MNEYNAIVPSDAWFDFVENLRRITGRKDNIIRSKFLDHQLNFYSYDLRLLPEEAALLILTTGCKITVIYGFTE